MKEKERKRNKIEYILNIEMAQTRTFIGGELDMGATENGSKYGDFNNFKMIWSPWFVGCLEFPLQEVNESTYGGIRSDLSWISWAVIFQQWILDLDKCRRWSRL